MSQNTQAAAATKSKFSVRDICYAGLFAAVIAVMAQISIPMPLGVPMTMQTFAITLAAVVLGSKLSAIASLVYLALGAVGVPVLANFSGGFDKFVGPTGGFLISFPLMAYIIGLGVEHRNAFRVLSSPLSSSARWSTMWWALQCSWSSPTAPSPWVSPPASCPSSPLPSSRQFWPAPSA